MKAPLAFDPRDYEYGAPTAAVRALMRDWAAIDWFEPSVASDGYLIKLLNTFQQLAHARDPETFPTTTAVRCVGGSRAEFADWCDRVRIQEWDWKISALKRLSSDHADDHDWTIEDDAADLVSDPPRPGDLFVTLPGTRGDVFWNTLLPRLPLLDVQPRDHFTDSALFYLGYAHGDVLDAIKWQLVENHDDTRTNPFLPLLHAYAAGAYPFSLGRDEVVLFRFHGRS